MVCPNSAWRAYGRRPIIPPLPPEDADHNALLLRLLARPNVASKEDWVRQYDHEVIAQTAVKPFVGVERDGPADAAVIAPLHGSSRGW